MRHTEDHYTTSYPSLTECGYLVHHSYIVCPFCHGPKADNIVKLVTRLATGLEGTNGPQVKLDLKEWVPPDFDVNLFVSEANGRKLTNDLQQQVSS